MTKPTGRPRGRPKTKEYVTLMARVPLELAEQARRYAGRKQQPISEVLRDGLLFLLEQEDTSPLYMYDRKEVSVQVPETPAKVYDVKEDTPLVIEAPQIRQSPIMPDTKEDPLPLDTPASIKMSDIKEDSLPMETLPAKMSDIKEALEIPPFDQIKYRLGRLCPAGHDYEDTGQSLRVNNKAGYCIACNVDKKRTARANKRQAPAPA